MQSTLFVLAELMWLQDYDKLRKSSGKTERHFVSVFFQHRGSCVLSNIEGFVERKANSYRLRNPALRDLLLVYQQRHCTCFADAAAIVFEFNADDMIAWRERLV